MDMAIGGVASTATPAGFWLRFGAFLIDGAVVAALVLVAFALTLDPRLVGAGELVALLCPWLYFSLLESSPRQATVGKRVVGVVVTDTAGRRLGFGRASARYWAKWVSAAILMLGFVMAAFTPRKQALHDLLAGTLVVTVR